MATRLQIPTYTDRWMMGDRYGDLLKITKHKNPTLTRNGLVRVEIAHIKLDKSGKTVRVALADCEII